MKVHLTVFVAVLCGCAVTEARRKRERSILRFSDCGKETNRPIRFYDVKASPMPVIIPGTLYVSLSGNVTEDLPRRISIELSIMKYFFGIPFMIPCFDNHIGSCTYDNICQRLEKYENSGCPKTLRSYNVQCHCPFQAGDFTVSRVPVNVPKINGFAGALINNSSLTLPLNHRLRSPAMPVPQPYPEDRKRRSSMSGLKMGSLQQRLRLQIKPDHLVGDYELVLSILDENRSQLGCLELKFSMKKRHRGWLFKI